MWDEHRGGETIGLEVGRAGFDPARPSLLMIHGSGGDRRNYRAQLSGIKGVNTAAIDMPGHGDTPGPGLGSVEEMADWVAGFIAAGPVRPVVLGHSLGGAVALMLGLKRPELVRGLIIVGSGSKLKVLPAILDGLQNAFPQTVGMVIKYAYGDDPDPALVKRGQEEMLEVPSEVIHGDFSACDAFDLSPRLGEIKPPALMIVGAEDKLTPPKYSEFLDKGLANSQGVAVIPGGGHMIYIENHAAFNQAVEEFMATL